ncbi:hypothetical protein [Pseudomonas leptonychotis]|uniref:hypothetical protein n=1 Tax=Pseudomonas leptonychotis TaxID=2448482 RepID=UPI0010AB4C72|nr:hypothetical protein [Pseudomonas leptonychotis]
MRNKRLLKFVSALITLLIASAGLIYYLFAEVNHRNRIAIDLFTNSDGNFNYTALEALLNNNIMTDNGFTSVVEFVTKHNGACNENRCRLPVILNFCITQNAIITIDINEQPQRVKVEKSLDGC